MIKAIIFDLGGVVFKPELKKSINRILKTKERLFSHTVQKKLMRGKIHMNKVYSLIGKKTNKGYAAVRAAYLESLSKKTINGMPQLLETLKAKYVLAVITNTSKPSAYHHKKEGHYRWFKHKILSCDVGEAKPGKNIFMIMLKKLKNKPDECIFVDDLEVNVRAARSIGMNAIQFKSAKQLKIDLKKFGVTP